MIQLDDFIWEYKVGDFLQNWNIMPSEIELIGKTFYTCAYLCPRCKRNMFKANTNGNIEIKTPFGMETVLSIFACFNCKMMFTARRKGTTLSDGEYFMTTNGNNVLKTFQVTEKVGIDITKGLF